MRDNLINLIAEWCAANRLDATDRAIEALVDEILRTPTAWVATCEDRDEGWLGDYPTMAASEAEARKRG